MQRLAGGDTSAKIPSVKVNDELGAMTRAVLVFRDNMVERARLSTAQDEASQAREQRSEVIAATITRFETSVDQMLAKVREAALRLDAASTRLNGAADQVSAEEDAAAASRMEEVLQAMSVGGAYLAQDEDRVPYQYTPDFSRRARGVRSGV